MTVVGRSAEQLLHEFRTNAAADATMSLLRSSNALLYLALMATHLGDGQIVDGRTLAAAIDSDLPGLWRSYAVEDADAHEPVVPDADVLLTRWTKKGWVHRSIAQDTRVERYQLTSGANQAVRQVRNLQRQTSIATESALSMVMAEMRQIATHANPDPTVRRQAINDQIAALAEERDALDRGDVPAVNQTELADRVTTLAQLIERIPADIARYGEQMHANTAALLRQSLTDDPAEFAQSLQRMFDGHDVIADSPEGQAFRAFATLIGTPSQRVQLETDVAEVVGRVEELPAHLVELLQGFIDAMWQRVQEVEDTRGTAFRRISTFVRGGDTAYYRSMRTRISEAQASAAEAFQRTHGGRDIGFVVPVSGVETASVGRLRLQEGIAARPDPVTDSNAEFDIDPTAHADRESIDWAALRSAVHAAMEAHSGCATLPEVLDHLDAARTGEVMGLWWLATCYGDVDETTSATVWAHTAGGLREITIPYLAFADHMPDLARPAGQRRPLNTQLMLLEGAPDA